MALSESTIQRLRDVFGISMEDIAAAEEVAAAINLALAGGEMTFTFGNRQFDTKNLICARRQLGRHECFRHTISSACR